MVRFKILKVLHTISGNLQQNKNLAIKKIATEEVILTDFSPRFKQIARLNIESI